MLKKRILASSMASVMALSGVSVAAFADTKDYGEAVSKAELEEYIKSFDKFLETDITDYGSTQGENFQDAIDHATAVLENEDSEAKDYTAAYQMVKSVYDHLEMKSKADLQALVKDNQSIYDSNNIMNEDIQDNIYEEDSYADFASAFEDADRYVDSGDSRIITDAWFALKEAVDGLEELGKVTKSEFRKAIKDYEALVESSRDFEDWRRGKVTAKFSDDSKPAANGDSNRKKLANSEVRYVTFGQLKNITYGTSNAVVVNDDGTSYGAANKLWLPVNGAVGTGTVEDFVTSKYKYFDGIKASYQTTDEEIVLAYNTAIEAVKVFKSWKEDNTRRSSKAGIATLLREYHNDMAVQIVADDIATAVTAIEGLGDGYTTNEDYLEKKKLTCKKAIAVLVDKETGKWTVTDAPKKDVDSLSPSSTQKAQKISAGTDILQYIPVTAAKVSAYASAVDGETTTVTAAQTDLATAQGTLDTKQGDYDDALDDHNDALAAITAEDKDAFDALKDAVGDAIEAYENGTPSGFTAQNDTDSFNDGTDDIYKLKVAKSDGTAWSANTSATEKAVTNALKAYNDAWDLSNAVYETTNGTKDKLATALADLNTAKANVATKQATLDRANAKADTVTMGYIEDLQLALENYEAYLDLDFSKDDHKAAGLAIIDTLDDWDQISKASGSTAEWTLIYRKVLYALNDLYPEDSTEYTLSQLRKLIDDSYDLAEDTGDSSLFATPHGELVDVRQNALEWYTAARKTKGYKDGDKITAGSWTDKSVTVVYEALKEVYDTLNSWLKGFKYGYGEIKDKIATISTEIDNGDIKATDDLKKQLAQASYDLSVLEASLVKGEDINQPFDEERVFDVNNRLKTEKGKSDTDPNGFEKNLKKSYEALLEAYDKAKGGATGDFDFDGDGKLSLGDVSALLEAYLASSSDTAKYDYDGNGKFELDDVSKMLDAYLAV